MERRYRCSDRNRHYTARRRSLPLQYRESRRKTEYIKLERPSKLRWTMRITTRLTFEISKVASSRMASGFAARNLLERATAIWRLHEVAVPSHLVSSGAPAAPSDLQRIATGGATAGVNDHG
jgi:hypothetical protein